MNGEFLGYEPYGAEIGPTRSGVLVAAETGTAVTYGLNNAQDRGTLFIEAGTEVYEGMVAGVHSRDNDIVANVCKEKKMTNVRASTSDIAIKLTPPVKMSLEEFWTSSPRTNSWKSRLRISAFAKRSLRGASADRAERSGAKVQQRS